MPKTNQPAAGHARPGRDDSPAPSPVILLVDDDPAVRNILSRMLRRAGYDVVERDSGEGALAFLASELAIDLVVCDGYLGSMHGNEVAQKVAGLRPEIPFIIVSGHVQQENGPMDGYPGRYFLAKPFPGPTLVALVKQALDDR